MHRLVCTHCGTADRTRLPGSGWIELVLYLFYIVPGVIYSIWRRTGSPACAACGQRSLISAQTPVGQRLAADAPRNIPEPPRGPSKTTAYVLVGLMILLWAGQLLR
jgi:hypothetical protein